MSVRLPKMRLDTVIELYSGTSGIRDLEQAAEHIAANALYQIEVEHVKEVVFDGEAVRKLLLLKNIDARDKRLRKNKVSCIVNA